MKTEIIRRGKIRIKKYYNNENIVDKTEILNDIGVTTLTSTIYPDGKTLKEMILYYDNGSIWQVDSHNMAGEMTSKIIYDKQGVIIEKYTINE
jgi:hypothetical protein